MSSTPVLSFIKDITAKNTKAVQERLKSTPAQSSNQSFADPKEQGLSYSLLHKAVEVGSLEIIGALLAAGADVNAPDTRGRTPLHWLASSTDAGAVNTAELLLKQPGIDVHASSKFKATPLHEAAAAGNAPLLQILLKRGAQVQNSTSGFTPLHAACMGSCMRPPAPAAMPAQPAGIQDPVLQDITQHSEPQHEAMQDQQQNPAAPAPTSVAAKPGQLKSAPSKPELAQLLRPKPPASAVPKKMGTALLQRPTPSSRTPATSARTAVTSTRSTAISTGSKVAMPAGTGTAAAGALRASPPPAAAEAAGLRKSQPAAAQVLNRSAPQVQRVSGDVVQLLLGAAPSLLGAQDCEGFTPLMRLVQRGLADEAQSLVAAGDCNFNAQAASTAGTVLHLACSSASPDLQLVSALVAAGADAMLPRPSDGNTPLLLAAKAGGQAGLALAKALLQTSIITSTGQQGQTGQEAASPLWCPLDGDSPTPGGASSSAGGVNAVNAAGETAVGVAAAVVLEARTSSNKPAAAAAQQELLVLLLGQQAKLPQQQAQALLQHGLAGKLSDSLTAKVVDSMPDMASLKAAAAAAAGAQQLEFESLLGAKLYRTAVALLCKGSGKRACDDVDANGNTLLHRAVCGEEDLPEYVAALVEANVPVNAANKEHDTALHTAARHGHLEACRALVAAGADLLRRNGKNRIPGSQLKLSNPIKAYLQDAEEAFRAAKEEQRHALWDGRMRATQTQSAFGIRVT